jgi:hypothetical protein
MRSSQKSNRNRGNKNRSNKSLGNVQNRVFESAGPEGKVRGTPQQIIDKYEQLARDAQTSGDRVVAENFLQHAEHYARMLSQAQAEMAAHQQAQQRQNEQPRQHDQGGGGGQNRNDGKRGDGKGGDGSRNDVPRADAQPQGGGGDASGGGLETIDTSDEGPSLVTTPEAPQPNGEGAAKPRSRRRRGPRKDRAEDAGAEASGGSDAGGEPASKAAEAPKAVAETPAEGG